MAIASVIRLEGTVTALRDQRLVMVRLSNGHLVFAHASRADSARIERVVVGQMVAIDMSPADMSRGRLRFEEKRQKK